VHDPDGLRHWCLPGADQRIFGLLLPDVQPHL